MQPKSDKSNPTEPLLHTVPANSAFPEPWWCSIGYNPIPPFEQGKSDSTFRCSNGGSDSNGGRSQSDDGESEGDDEESRCGSPNAASPRLGEAHGRELQNQLADPNVPSMYDDHVSRPPHLELAGHSITYPFVGIPHARMPLPLDLAQEPVYVNSKQFQGILRRRQARAKAELAKKFIKVRKPYLHESRHQHVTTRREGKQTLYKEKRNGCFKRCLIRERHEIRVAIKLPVVCRYCLLSCDTTVSRGHTHRSPTGFCSFLCQTWASQEKHVDTGPPNIINYPQTKLFLDVGLTAGRTLSWAGFVNSRVATITLP